MSQSLAKILVHIIFSTKNRHPFLKDDVRVELHRYMATILKEHESPAILIGSVEDHVHILCSQSKNFATSTLIEEAKKGSSRWIKTKGTAYGTFQWQNGYGAFSVSQSHVDDVVHYIAHQKEHHRKMTFEDQFRSFLKKHRVDYDERYVWD
jgi:REP element-mobilizing transposase RayT